jgi:hypothetical protein
MRGRNIRPCGQEDLLENLDLKNKMTFYSRLNAHDGKRLALRIPAAIPTIAALILQNH